jgi:hypothetical protein
MHRKVYKRAFLGNELLQKGDAPIKGRFSWACITGELDRNKGHWFGLIKTMRDPQMWANKWLSQTLHILNTTAKGGIVGEMDAFADMTEAEEKWGATRYDRLGHHRRGVQPEDHAEAGRRPHPKPCGPDAADRKPELTTGSSS